MSDLIKNLLGIALIAGLVVVGYSSLQFVSNYGKSIEPSSFRSFWVSGDGKAVSIPDVAEFSFSVVTEGGEDVGTLQQENAKKMTAATQFVKGQSIDAKDITTQNYSIYPRYETTICEYDERRPCPPPSIVGYTVSQSATVKVRDFSKVSNLLSGVVKAGANTVSQLSFTMDDPTSVQDAARAEALEKASQRAEKIADQAGFSLGRILEIDEGYISTPYQPRAMMEASFSKGMDADIAPPIEPGSQEVQVTMRIKYEIE
ncbi:MAG: SIMPL domain-containing protein [Candidatus Altimarinota bacterium]